MVVGWVLLFIVSYLEKGQSMSKNLSICYNQGRVMLPMSLTTDDGPIYVNAKQYHGIIRRRQIRAKAMMENRLARTRKVCKCKSY